MSKQLCTCLIAVGLGGAACWADTLTPGNLVVVQIQTANRLNGLGQATRLREFSVAGSTFNSNELIFASDGTGLVLPGSDQPSGQLQRSPDGRYLSMIGYSAAADGDLLAAGRTIARIDQSFTATRFATNAQAGALARSAITNDGVNFFISGNLQGVQALNTAGGNTVATAYSTAPASVRVAQFGADGSTVHASGTAPGTSLFVNSVGAGGAFSPVVTAAGGIDPYDFQFAFPSLLYVAVAGGSRGLQRWELNNSAWTLAYTITGFGLNSIALTTDASGNNVIYATTINGAPFTGNSLVRVVDTGAASQFEVLATAPDQSAFRGVEFAPIPAPGAAALLVLSGFAAARRRRH